MVTAPALRLALHSAKAVIGTALMIVIATILTTMAISIVILFVHGIEKMVSPNIPPGSAYYIPALAWDVVFGILIMGFFGAILGRWFQLSA